MKFLGLFCILLSIFAVPLSGFSQDRSNSADQELFSPATELFPQGYIEEALRTGVFSNEYAAYLNKANDYFLERKYIEAIDEAKKAMEIQPELFHAYNMCGMLSFFAAVEEKDPVKRKKLLESCTAYLERALEHGAKTEMINATMGMSYQNLGEYSKSVYYYEKELEAGKLDSYYRNMIEKNLGMNYYYLGDYTAADEPPCGKPQGIWELKQS